MENEKKIWGRMPEFCGAFLDASTLPPHEGLEVAFIGRSNVGKSSIINTLFNTHKLARVSQTPGCTKALMLFKVVENFYLMDLPGYGFNKQPKHVQKQWVKAINSYLVKRRALSHVYLLIDSRRGVLDSDKDMVSYLNHYSIAHTCVLTKCDKASSKDIQSSLTSLKMFLDTKCTNTLPIQTSSVTKEGIEPLKKSILSYVGMHFSVRV